MPKNNLDQYKDPLGLTPKKMNFGLWYVSKRKKFRLAIIIVLSLISVVTWFITIYTFTHYIVIGIKEDEEIGRKITDNILFDHDYILELAPKNLNVGKVNALKHLYKYDLFAKIENPSKNYWAHFNYLFILDGERTKELSGFILPGESKNITSLAHIKKPKKAEIKIKDISWSRVDQHKIPNWKAFADEHMDIQFNNIEFTQSNKTGLSEKIEVSTLEFLAINNSPYNYWNVLLKIVLYNNGNVVSINEYILDQFLSGQERSVKISIPGLNSDITKTEIVPEIDITRGDVYMKY